MEDLGSRSISRDSNLDLTGNVQAFHFGDLLVQRGVPVLADQLLAREVLLEDLARIDRSEVNLVDLLDHEVIRGADPVEAHHVVNIVEPRRIVSPISLIWVDIVGHARLVHIESAAIPPEEALDNGLALRVTLDHRFHFLFDDDHVFVHNEAAHEVISQVSVPLLANVEIEARPQVVLDIVRLIGEEHPDHDCRVVLVKASRRSTLLPVDRALVIQDVEGRELLHLVVEEARQARFRQCQPACDLIDVLVLGLTFGVAELLNTVQTEDPLVIPVEVQWLVN